MNDTLKIGLGVAGIVVGVGLAGAGIYSLVNGVNISKPALPPDPDPEFEALRSLTELANQLETARQVLDSGAVVTQF